MLYIKKDKYTKHNVKSFSKFSLWDMIKVNWNMSQASISWAKQRE